MNLGGYDFVTLVRFLNYDINTTLISVHCQNYTDTQGHFCGR